MNSAEIPPRASWKQDLAQYLEVDHWRSLGQIASGAIAAWMLYIQHQYEDTYYQAPGEWRFELAALQGSSYLQLPRPLAWVVGNANYHHVHHLSAKIPKYRLRDAHESHSMFRRTPVVTIRSSIETFRLKLWDTESQCLVSFPARRARSGSRTPGPGRETLPAS
jgi:fatty acid desaturase